MREKNTTRLQTLLWRRKAEIKRQDVAQIVRSIVPDIRFQFLDQQETEELGRRFWNRAAAEPERRVADFQDCKEYLDKKFYGEDEVVLFHRWTRETGALVLPLRPLLQHAALFRQSLGPDFLVLDKHERFGSCFEEGECGFFLRTWCSQT